MLAARTRLPLSEVSDMATPITNLDVFHHRSQIAPRMPVLNIRTTYNALSGIVLVIRTCGTQWPLHLRDWSAAVEISVRCCSS